MAGGGKYKRVLVKLSGESLCRAGRGVLDAEAMAAVVGETRPLVEAGLQVALVVGGGNMIRGRKLAAAAGIRQTTADYMGMLATVINGIALRDCLETAGLRSRVLSAFPIGSFVETFSPERALWHLEQGRTVVFVGGTSCPFFTTDTCAALRASEISADVLIKATKVDGVFDADPAESPDARKFDRLTYQQVLERRLAVMDVAAISLCRDNGVPIIVLDLFQPGHLADAASGKPVGTLVTD